MPLTNIVILLLSFQSTILAFKSPTTTKTTTSGSSMTTTSIEFPPPKDYSHLIIDNWFHERQPELWGGQAFTLQIKEILYHQKSKCSNTL